MRVSTKWKNWKILGTFNKIKAELLKKNHANTVYKLYHYTGRLFDASKLCGFNTWEGKGIEAACELALQMPHSSLCKYTDTVSKLRSQCRSKGQKGSKCTTGTSLIGFPSESFIFCPKMSKWAIRSKKIRVGHPFFSKELSDLCILFRSL